MQSQENLEKAFYEQLKPGDYVDARNSQDQWKLAKVIDRDHKYISLMFDGYPPGNDHAIISSLKMKPLRAVTKGYTGPYKDIYFTITSIPDLNRHINTIDAFLKSQEQPSAYKINQFLRGELFSIVNSLIISQLKYSIEELVSINRFLLSFIDRVGQICIKVKKYLQQYFQSNLNNKYIYLSSFKIALIYSLQELLYLVYNMLLDGSTTPKLLKKYKNQISQHNFYNNIKQYLNVLVELCCANDSNGKWLPTQIRVLISKILLLYKMEKKFLEINYDSKDYLQFYPYWRTVMTIYPSQQTETKFIQYILNVMTKQSPFDAKLKCLVILKKILEKQTKLSFITIPKITEDLVRKNVVESLLKFFNPEIFKRYVPILKLISQTTKKSLTQSQIDTLFKIMKTCHESQQILIFETLINLSEFIQTEALDGIYYDIESTVDLNSEVQVKFVRDFTINAISNFNLAKNKGYLNSIIGRKKQSSKYGFYGLSLLVKQIMDKGTKIQARNIPFTISNIGNILEKEIFQSERSGYMNMCIGNIQKRESFGQSVQLVHKIICTYPFSSYVSDSQQSVVGKLDDKYRLVDTIVQSLKLFEKELNGPISGGKKNTTIKISFPQTVVNCHNLIQSFNSFCKYPLKLDHIEALWHMPHIFDFLKKSQEIEDNKQNKEKIPSWKKKYFKKLQNQIIKGILTQTLQKNENIIPSEECFNSVDELVISYNLGKNLQLTQRATVRYIDYKNIVGINFYFDFLHKLIALNKENWKQNKIDTQGSHLTKKVIVRIIELYLRPHEHMAIKKKIEGWMNCLKKIMKAISQNSADLCVWAIEQLLELIKGRQFKDINLTGKYELVVSYENRDKTISLPRNATFLKLRESIMQAYKLKCNFQMYSKYLKRQMSFTEQEDYSLNAIPQQFKGPTILVKKVQPDKLYPQTEAIQSFMNLLQQEQVVYDVLFGLLKNEDKVLQKRVWRLIDMVPVNKAIKSKMQNCKDFSEEDWMKVLSPTSKQMEEIQYSINIIYSLLNTSRWIELFKKTGGHLATEELYLKILSSNDPLSEKIVITLSKIILKILDHGPKQNEIQQGQSSGDQLTNLQKISIKIEKSVQKQIMNHEKRQELGDWTEHSIEYLNLILKVYIVVCLKKKIPSRDKLIEFLIDKQILLKVSDSILFEFKDTETVSFTEHIVLDKKLNLTTPQKEKLFEQFVLKYMKIQVLATKKSTENYFILLIDILHMIDKDSTNTFQSYPQVVEMIKQYVYDAVGITLKGQGESIEISQEMIYGCLKLLNETYSCPIFNYNLQQVFVCLLKNYTLHQNNSKQLEQERSLVTVSKIKLRHKKLLYDVMKRMISDHKHLLDIFVDKLTPKLSNAQWRRNMLSSWSLEQQKKEKKNFCGLENLAATCYINCLFQQLFMIKIFSDKFIDVDSLAYNQTPQTNEIYQFQKLLVYLKYGNKPSYTTRPFCESFITYEGVPIDPTIQNDADEFFNTLMEKIESFLRISNRHEILEETLQGKLSNQLNCQGCPHSSEKVEPFLSIGLDIKNKKTLEEALDGYVEGEILDGDNAYFCEKCEKKVRTMKRLCIKEAPNILVLVLKRFTFNFDEMRKIKINDELKFPQQLNIKKFTVDSAQQNEKVPDKHFDYKLRGIVVHAGSSQAGHYYSFIKQQNGANHKWFQFNDEIVQETDYKKIEEESFGGIEKDSEDRIQKYKNAYILLYEKENAPYCENQEVLAKQQSQQKETEDTYSYEEQLAQIVKSQNRTSEFLSIVLDQLFIRLCESITMCGSEKAHHFMILYFHTVLLRDRNKEEGEYLGNIYRTLIALLESNVELSLWFIQQINHNYIKQFLIEAPILAKYLCLGFVLTSMKAIHKYEIETVKQMNGYRQRHALIKQQKPESIEKEGSQVLTNQSEVNESKGLNESSSTQIDKTSSPNHTTQPQQTETNQQISVAQNQQQVQSSKPDFLKNDQIQPNMKLQTSEKELKKESHQNHIVEQVPEENSIMKLIPCLLFCLKKKGMTPFAKIFSFLSSIPKYQKVLLQNKYPQMVYGIITEKKFKNLLSFESRQSYFGHQNPNCKQKETEISYNFLVESLKNFPGFLQKSQIIEILDLTFYRAASKSLCQLLAKSSKSIEQVQQNIEYLHERLMNDKYRREDVDKYLFLLRFYFLQSDQRASDNRQEIQFGELVKTVCMNNFSRVIQENDNSHLLMELVVLQINKIAFKCENFKTKWISQVGRHLQLAKALENWIQDSGKPHLMQKNQQWKRKLASLNASEKQVATKRNISTQEKRTKWMLQNKDKSHNTQPLKFDKNQYPTLSSQADRQPKKKLLKVPEIHSDLQDTEIDKEISVGFRSFRIKERLGALIKVEDERGNMKWAILQKNDIDACLDF